jgi:hypothetical protein
MGITPVAAVEPCVRQLAGPVVLPTGGALAGIEGAPGLPSVGTLLAVVGWVLLAAGAVGSLLPVVPGAPVSLVGIHVVWWANGFGDPGVVVVAVATLLALVAVAVDVFGGAAAAGAAGTTTRVAAAAGLVGLLLALVTGPLGVLAGIAGTVYAAERYGGTGRRESLRTAGRTLAGILVANGVQFVLTSTALVVVALGVLL